MPTTMRRAPKSSAPGSTPSLTVSLKSLRNPPLDLSFSAQAATTSVLELKQKVAAAIGTPGTEKIRLLYRKKPCADSKSIKDLVGDEDGVREIEFSVMVMGGTTAAVEKEEEAAKGEEQVGGEGDVQMEDAPVTQGESGTMVMDRAEFWEDLKEFLEQRVRDPETAEQATRTFQQAWKGRGAA